MEDLDPYCLTGKPVYLVGSFSDNVTVYSQQVRALNLVHALIEAGIVKCILPPESQRASSRQRIAVIGGGVAGLSVAAGLIAKRADCAVTIFEQRDTLLPLQNGSDSRWLHPRIYDWPDAKSVYGVAMLPVLNWVAGRASDVAVQMLASWKELVLKRIELVKGDGDLSLFCNAKHLRLFDTGRAVPKLQIEFVAEHRDPRDGTEPREGERGAVGGTRPFDLAIVAAGFGVDRDGGESYWRNDTFGQPSLEKPRRTYLVSGQGDGAIIDLQRLCIAQFRQDRILSEMFHKAPKLLEELRGLHAEFGNGEKPGLLTQLTRLKDDDASKNALESVQAALRRRLRRDTEVIFHVQVKQLSELFDPGASRISFQNRVMLWLLYECGAFIPSSLDIDALIKQHDVQPNKRVIRRHGTKRLELLEEILSDTLYAAIDKDPKIRSVAFAQSGVPQWLGGYFAHPGTSTEAANIPDDDLREIWRKEYLPGPTQLLASTFCASLAGYIGNRLGGEKYMRVTLHRAAEIGPQEILQQCCEYAGKQRKRTARTAGRTFPAQKATIGLAYECRKIVRSFMNVDRDKLQAAMKFLDLGVASRKMAQGVRFVLAIPILEPDAPGKFTAPAPVAGVIYIDSDEDDFFIDDEFLRELVVMTKLALAEFELLGAGSADRLWNVPISTLGATLAPAKSLPEQVREALEFVEAVEPPVTTDAFQFNFDFADVDPPPS